MELCKGLSIKDVRSQGVCPVRTNGKGYSDADVRAFWCKNFEFFKIYCVRTDMGGGGGG